MSGRRRKSVWKAAPRPRQRSTAQAAAARRNGARGGRQRATGPSPAVARRLEAYAALGPPPTDPLARTEWTQSMLTIALWQIATDPHLKERQRRQEMRATSRLVGDLVPPARLFDAEQRVRRFYGELEDTKGPETKHAAERPAGSLRADRPRGRRARAAIPAPED